MASGSSAPPWENSITHVGTAISGDDAVDCSVETAAEEEEEGGFLAVVRADAARGIVRECGTVRCGT